MLPSHFDIVRAASTSVRDGKLSATPASPKCDWGSSYLGEVSRSDGGGLGISLVMVIHQSLPDPLRGKRNLA
jgi:hypothetical protein